MRLPARPSLLKTANNLLLLGIILVCGYVLLLPLLPMLTYWWQGKRVSLESFQQTAVAQAQAEQTSNPNANQLVIPRLRLRQPLFEGASKYTVNKGIWVQPKASTPDKGSNTVLIGHRFTYQGPAVFYHLDQVLVNDRLVVFWYGQEYHYQVSEVKVVPPTATEIEGPSDRSQLTLYTCTPLITAKNRLVVIAREVPS